jgi:colicin import membrane protein
LSSDQAKTAKAEAAAKAKAEAAEQAKTAKAEAAAKAKAEAAEQAKADKAEAEAKAKLEAAAQVKAAQAALEAEYTQKIQRKVGGRWIQPPDSSGHIKCTVSVLLSSSGEVLDANVISCNDDIATTSVENAVRSASPLPVPPDKDLFNSKFKRFKFSFNH